MAVPRVAWPAVRAVFSAPAEGIAMFYLIDEGEFVRIVQTQRMRVDGTWHTYRDEDGYEWKRRGRGAIRLDIPSAVAAFIEANPSRTYSACLAMWRLSFEQGLAVGECAGIDKCRASCAHQPKPSAPPKPRAFLRRLLSGRPLSA